MFLMKLTYTQTQIVYIVAAADRRKLRQVLLGESDIHGNNAGHLLKEGKWINFFQANSKIIFFSK